MWLEQCCICLVRSIGTWRDDERPSELQVFDALEALRADGIAEVHQDIKVVHVEDILGVWNADCFVIDLAARSEEGEMRAVELELLELLRVEVFESQRRDTCTTWVPKAS